MKNKTIWWIWTWIMWEAMASNLIKDWYKLNVYNRTKAKTDELVKAWAIYIDNIAEITKKSDIIISIIWNPKSVLEVYFWKNWIIENITENKIIIDMTSTTPTLAKRIYLEAKEKWAEALDAPVSGWDIWAKWWTLAIMVWWEKETFERVMPIFEILWKNIVYEWIAWNGQHTKVANQIWMAWNLIWVCEAMIYAEKADLDIENVIKIVSSWAAWNWAWNNLAPKILDWELDTVFFVKHFTKDLKLALLECDNMNLALPWLALINELYKSLRAYDWDNLWTQALITVLRRMNNMNSEK